ncbi:MAG: DUF5667 domain-containing protein [Patescibacteria group bacterium]
MKKIIVFILILLIIISVSKNAVLAMVGVKKIPTPKAYIAKVDGEEALIKKLNANDWIKITENMEIAPGDIIKTNNNSQVVINFYDNTVSRVDSNSEIKFEEISIDKENFAKTKVNIFVNAGQIWSRVIQLMDKDASFEINSSITVATVRGTAFNFEIIPNEESAKINTIEGILEIAKIKTKEEIDESTGQKKQTKIVIEKINLPEGNMAIVGKEKETENLLDKKIITQPILEENLKSKWFKDNQKLDEDFEKEVKEKAKKLNKEIAGILPDSAMYKIKRIAEKARIILTNDPTEKQKLIIDFANKRLSEAQQLAQEGKVVLAEATINNWQKSVDELTVDPEIIKKQTKNQFNLQKQIAGIIAPDSVNYNLRNILEDLEIKNEQNKADKEYLELKKVGQALKEIKLLKEKGKENLFEELIKKQEKILKELEKTPYQELINHIKLERDLLIQKKENLIKENKIKVEEKLLEPEIIKKQEQTPAQTQTSEQNQIPKIIEPLRDIVPENIIPNVEVKIKTLASLIVSADKYNMIAGKTKQFTAIARYNDNSTEDVTNKAVWTLVGDLGNISQSGLLQTNNTGGKGIVNAVFVENGIVVNGSSPEITALTIEF